MGTYNILIARIECPRCGHVVNQQIEARFCYTADLKKLSVGDFYPWRLGKQFQNGGRPDSRTIDGEGYVECALCGKDFFVTVSVVNDIITSVKPDSSKKGYVDNRDI